MSELKIMNFSIKKAPKQMQHLVYYGLYILIENLGSSTKQDVSQTLRFLNKMIHHHQSDENSPVSIDLRFVLDKEGEGNA